MLDWMSEPQRDATIAEMTEELVTDFDGYLAWCAEQDALEADDGG